MTLREGFFDEADVNEEICNRNSCVCLREQRGWGGNNLNTIEEEGSNEETNDHERSTALAQNVVVTAVLFCLGRQRQEKGVISTADFY